MTETYLHMCSFENLYEAHEKSRRGKRNKNEVVSFELDIARNLYLLQWELLSGRYEVGKYHTFRIHDPKLRTIHALCYRDRIVQHTLCDNIIVPYMERHLIYDNAASRKEKGTHFAMDRLTKFLREFYRKHGTKGYILKFDIHHYYNSIDHEILKKLFDRAFAEEPQICILIHKIIDSYQMEEGKGIPLGNQTSSWFALYYLDGLDRRIKERLQVKFYSRYMDDGVMIHESKEYLEQCLEEMRFFLREERNLSFNQKTQIVPVSQGVDYLGFHYYLTDTGKVVRKLRSSNKRRMKRKLKRFRHAYKEEKITMEEVTRSLVSYRGHLSHGHTYHLQKNLLQHLILTKGVKEETGDETKEMEAQMPVSDACTGDAL